MTATGPLRGTWGPCPVRTRSSASAGLRLATCPLAGHLSTCVLVTSTQRKQKETENKPLSLGVLDEESLESCRRRASAGRERKCTWH